MEITPLWDVVLFGLPSVKLRSLKKVQNVIKLHCQLSLLSFSQDMLTNKKDGFKHSVSFIRLVQY